MTKQSAPLPLVSVVIPAYNASRTLGETLDSVLAQTYSNIEIIVVNDGSTDATAAVLQSYKSRIQTIEQLNSGLPVARNVGCLAANGEYIALLDADDLCAPERISMQTAVMQTRPAAVLCSSDFYAFSEDGLAPGSFSASYYSMVENSPQGLGSLYPEHEQIETEVRGRDGSLERRKIGLFSGNVYRKLAHGNFVHPPTVMFRRRVLDIAGLFDENLRYTCDWEWMVRVSRTGAFIHISHPMLGYRLSPSQMSSKSRVNGESALEIIRASKKIWHSDPELMESDRALIRRHLGEFYYDAAYAFAESKRIQALGLLARGIWFQRALRLTAFNVLLKVFMPSWLTSLVRSLRKEMSGSRHL